MNYIILFILLLFSCTNYNNQNNINNISEQQFSTNTSASRLPINEDTTINTDTTIGHYISNDTAYLMYGDKITAATYVSPIKIIGDSINPKEQYDEAVFIANCLVVLRNIRTAGHFCHTPEVEKAEIYTLLGDTIIVSGKNAQVFYGNKYTSPDGKWAIINNEAEGMLYGYRVFYENGTFLPHEVEIYESMEWYSDGNARYAFAGNETFIWYYPNSGSDSVLMKINKAGKYWLRSIN
jgi:hypothetical protein